MQQPSIQVQLPPGQLINLALDQTTLNIILEGVGELPGKKTHGLVAAILKTVGEMNQKFHETLAKQAQEADPAAPVKAQEAKEECNSPSEEVCGSSMGEESDLKEAA